MNARKKGWAIITLICFALTLLPTAAFAGVAETWSVYTIDEDPTVLVEEEVEFALDFDGATTKQVYVWFVKDGMDVPSTSAEVKGYNADAGLEGVYVLTGKPIESGDIFKVSFHNTGKYTIAASAKNPYIAGKSTSECIRNVDDRIVANDSHKKTITVENNSDSKHYTMQLVGDAGLVWSGFGTGLTSDTTETTTLEKTVKNNATVSLGAGGNLSTAGVNNHLNTNGVPSEEITFKLLDKDGKAVQGATVKLSTSNTNCVVNKKTVTTDQLGQFKFTIAITEESPNIDGFTVYLETGAYEAKIKVTASSTGAYDLVVTKMPQKAFSTEDCTAGSRLDDLWIAVKDVHGNFVKPFALQPGGKFQEPAFAGVVASNFGSTFTGVTSYIDGDATENYMKWGKSAEEYVSIVRQPSNSKLENKDIWLCPVGMDAAFQNTLYTKKDMVAGDYTFKVTLANGKYKLIRIKVAEMGTPVKITVTPKAAVTELGSRTSASIQLVDANGVTCDALKKGTEVAVSGYGVEKANVVEKDSKVDIYTKNDEKYAGKEIQILATNERYHLTGQGTIQLTDGKAFLYCPVNKGTVNTPIDLTYVLMDGQKMMNFTIGNLNGSEQGDFRVTGGQTGFVVVSKPEGATVNFDARAAGGAITSISGDAYAVGRIECDKPGMVTIQMTIGVEILQADKTTWSPRYYEGTQNILFTEAGAGKTVVMSIGSNELVVNDAKARMDAAPIVQNNRTFVPFRALAEAFGATVAYDEATQAVTAELNGIKVVMPIGSATYTVNGAEKTADVAPWIRGSRTMIPVRFAAEAFGIQVTPTYDTHGATADVLFTL